MGISTPAALSNTWFRFSQRSDQLSPSEVSFLQIFTFCSLNSDSGKKILKTFELESLKHQSCLSTMFYVCRFTGILNYIIFMCPLALWWFNGTWLENKCQQPCVSGRRCTFSFSSSAFFLPRFGANLPRIGAPSSSPGGVTAVARVWFPAACHPGFICRFLFGCEPVNQLNSTGRRIVRVVLRQTWSHCGPVIKQSASGSITTHTWCQCVPACSQ